MKTAPTKKLIIGGGILLVLLSAYVIARQDFAVRWNFTRYIEQRMPESEEAMDFIDDQGRLDLQNNKTVRYLLEIITTADVQDITHAALSTWPTPLYYIGDDEIGGNGFLVYDYLGRNYIFVPNASDYEKLVSYVNKVTESGAESGIE